jgi:C-terminal processing protease CtpA/Prc
MRQLLLPLLFLFSVTVSAQQRSYNPKELQRLADLGRLWGMLHYFHPVLYSGTVVTDSLVVQNATLLAADPSAANFQKAVDNMLLQLGDASTRLKPGEPGDSFLLFTPAPNAARVQKFASGYWYISLPTAATENPATPEVPSLLPSAWDSAKGIVLDLRNARGPVDEGRFYYTYLPMLLSKLAGAAPVTPVEERIPYHNGFINQSDGTANIYFSGWRTTSRGTPLPPSRPSPMVGTVPFNKPVLVVVNRTNSGDLIKGLLALQAAGKCRVVMEGTKNDLPAGNLVDVALADNLVAQIRTSDYLLNGKGLPEPGRYAAAIRDVSETSPFLQQCFADLADFDNVTAKERLESGAFLPGNFVLPKPAAYPNYAAPPVGLRLFALYNFWNAIHYFFPYKNLLPSPWTDKLTAHLPAFLQAEDGLSYALALRSLVSDIHDSHGFVYNTVGNSMIQEAYGYRPPLTLEFINSKLYVVGIKKDSLQPVPPVQLWDEVVAINGLPVQKALDGWRSYMPASNEAAFRRDVANLLLAGTKDSRVTVDINSKGGRKSHTLIRSGRNNTPDRKLVDFNDDYTVMQKLPGNIGYVNMGALTANKVDSLFTTLMDTKAIIFDIRNYPRGTAWSIAPRLARKDSVAVRFEAPLVTFDHIGGGESAQDAVSYFTVRADTSRPRYRGKVVMLCNEQTQSQAEYTIMMFQGATPVTVVGSQTAGADGNVTDVVLPGGYRAMFSGTAILYPDGSQTQRTGIRIDVPVKPSLAGLMAGRDEVLERAVRYINTGK